MASIFVPSCGYSGAAVVARECLEMRGSSPGRAFHGGALQESTGHDLSRVSAGAERPVQIDSSCWPSVQSIMPGEQDAALTHAKRLQLVGGAAFFSFGLLGFLPRYRKGAQTRDQYGNSGCKQRNVTRISHFLQPLVSASQWVGREKLFERERSTDPNWRYWNVSASSSDRLEAPSQ